MVNPSKLWMERFCYLAYFSLLQIQQQLGYKKNDHQVDYLEQFGNSIKDTIEKID